MVREYNAYTNVGINKRCTAMPNKETIKLTNITRLPSGRAMAAHCRGVWVVYLHRLVNPIDRREKFLAM